MARLECRRRYTCRGSQKRARGFTASSPRCLEPVLFLCPVIAEKVDSLWFLARRVPRPNNVFKPSPEQRAKARRRFAAELLAPVGPHCRLRLFLCSTALWPAAISRRNLAGSLYRYALRNSEL